MHDFSVLKAFPGRKRCKSQVDLAPRCPAALATVMTTTTRRRRQDKTCSPESNRIICETHTKLEAFLLKVMNLNLVPRENRRLGWPRGFRLFLLRAQSFGNTQKNQCLTTAMKGLGTTSCGNSRDIQVNKIPPARFVCQHSR